MTRVYYKRRATVNRVYLNGDEVFNVTVTIIDDENGRSVTVTDNPHAPGVSPNSGGGGGEEQPPKK